MNFYSDMAAVALEQLTEFGQDVALRNYTVGTYDPADGTVPTTYADVTRKGALFDFGAGQINGPGGLIQGGDKRLLLQAGTVPALEDHVIVDSVDYVIKGVGEVNPAGTPVLYDLHLRR